MKKIKVLFLFLAIFTCTACGRKAAITGEKFYDLTNEDYTVNDINDMYDFATSAYEAKGKNSFDIIFIETDKEITAKSLYLDEAQNAYKKAVSDSYLESATSSSDSDDSDDSSKSKITKTTTSSDDDIDVPDTIVKSKSFSTYEVSTSTKYYRIVWVKNTLMIGSIEKSKKVTLLNYMKGLGY